MGYIDNKKLNYLLASIVLSSSLLASCQSRKPEEVLSCDLPSLQNTTITNNNNSNLDVSINVDGSDSMLGYVTVPNNNYMRTLELIANGFIKTNQVNVTYQRIGDEQPLTRNQFRRDATSRAFYDSNDDSYKSVSSPIQSAITPPSNGKNKITVIVTDLEGDDGGKVSEVLAQHYLNKRPENNDYTVGIWAVKSEFQGNIYNPNTGKVKFTYNTDGKQVDSYRPFYVLFIGKYQDIANYFDEFKKLDNQIQGNDKMFILPTRNSLINPITLGTLTERKNNATLPENNQLQRFSALEDNQVVVTRVNDKSEPYELLEIVDENEPQPQIDYSVSFLPKKDLEEYSLLINDGNLTTQKKLFTFQENNQTPQQSQSQSEAENNQTMPKIPQEKTYFQVNSSNSLQRGLVIEDLQINNQAQTLDFTTTIDLNSLSNSQIYLFEIDLLLNDITSLDWWSDWSFDNRSGSLDGAKTQNLSLFMNKLKSLKLQTLQNDNQETVIGRLCFGLQTSE